MIPKSFNALWFTNTLSEKKNFDCTINLDVSFLFSAETQAQDCYANPVAIADFAKHCVQRRKYPVLLQIEFNNATRERDDQVCKNNSRQN